MRYRHQSQRYFGDEQLDQRLKAGLVGHWVGGGAGFRWQDRSGYGHTGTLTGGPTWTVGEGWKRNAVQFDGTDDYVNAGASARYPNSGALTFSAWIFPRASSGVIVTINAVPGENSFCTFWIQGTYALSFRRHTSGGSVDWQTTSNAIIPNTWNHVAVTWGGVVGSANTSIFVNGIECAYATAGDGSGSATDLSGEALNIGRSGGNSNYFNGVLDDVRVYNKALSKSLISLMGRASFLPIKPTSRRHPGALGIAFDAASNSGYQAAQSTYSWTHVNAGNFLGVDVSRLSVPGTTVTGITYNSVAMTNIGSAGTASDAGNVSSWRLVAPFIGSASIVVTLSAVCVSSSAAVSYYRVHQSSPTESFNSATATNVGAADATVNITPIADLCWVHGAVATDDGSITANQTSRNNVSGAGGSGANEDNNVAVTPPASTTMSYTNVAALATWVIAGYAIRPLSASTITTNRVYGYIF